MFTSIREIENNTKILSDICIIGGGPAGITLANELNNYKVIIMEGGELEFSESSQNFYKGELTGNARYKPDLDICRLRYWGGASNHWGGWCLPLTRFDFQNKNYNYGCEWPISYEEYIENLNEACKYCDLTDAEKIFENKIDDKSNLLNVNWYFSKPTRFGEKYFSSFKTSKNINVIYGANFQDFVKENGKIRETVFANNNNSKKIKISSKIYILACGGIENARILLNQRHLFEDKFINSYDLIGRNFQEHIAIGYIADLIPFSNIDKKLLKNLFNISGIKKEMKSYDDLAKMTTNYREKYKLDKLTGLTIDPSSLLKRETLNSSFFFSEYLTEVFDENENVKNIEEVYEGHITNNPKYKKEFKNRIAISIFSEQSVNELSRVYLNNETDIIGLKRVTFNWNLNKLDKKTIVDNLIFCGKELNNLGYGRLKFKKPFYDLINGWGPDTGGGAHHMCSTKMGLDPQFSVVDKNCKLHSCSNLFVAGSSVFPSGGAANPTLSIIMLSIRLSKRIKFLFS